jgi:hypothetical protein
MKLSAPLARAAMAVVSLGLLAASAHARNEKFLQPVYEAMRKSHTREIVGDMPVRFGAPTAAQADIVRADVVVEGVGTVAGDDPRKHRVGTPTDEEVCLLAFEDAIGKLVRAARDAGAAAILGVVSDYKGQTLDDARNYECHAGLAKSYVTLRAQLSRTIPLSRTLPVASGYAGIDDVDALPASDQAKERYRHFLTLPSPRAFVLFEDGSWRFYDKDPDAMVRALDYCARLGKRCWLYAANDRVVWSPDVSKRISSSAQLEGGPAAAAVVDEHQ